MRDNWTEATLGEVATWSTGKNLSASKRSSAGAHPILGANGLIGRTNEVLLDCDLITVGRVGACGETHRSAGPVWVSDNALIAIPNNRVLIDYLYHVLSVFEYQTITSGTTQPLITKNKLKNQVIQLPPLAEQKRIVDVAASVDTYIAALQQQAVDARSASNAVLYELLSASEDQWLETTLSEICDVRDGTHDSPKESPKGYPLVTSKNIRNGKVDLSDTYLISESDYVEINKRSKVDQFDLLIGMIGTVGEVCFEKNSPIYAIKNVGLIKAGNQLLGQFLFHYLSSSIGQDQIKSSTSGSTQKFIGLGRLRSLRVLLPPLPEQQKIVEIVSSMDDVVSLTEQAVTDAHNLRSGLLSNLLSGEHEIPETYDRCLGAA